MTTAYPGGLDSLKTNINGDTDTLATVPHDAQHNNANAAINAIEATLGINPQGSAATVAARLQSMVGLSLTAGTATTGAPGTDMSFSITGEAPNQVLNLTIPRGQDGIALSGPDIVLWGDSLAAQMGTVDLAAATGHTVRNGGVGGESSIGVAAREGADPYILLPVGGAIPASGGVQVTIIAPAAWPLLQGAGTSDGTFAGTLAGVHGVLTLTQPSGPSLTHLADDVYTFTRDSAGSAVTVNRPEPFYTDFSTARRGDIAIIWAGRNNSASLDQVRSDIRVMINYLDRAQARYLVVSIPNGRGEASGTSTYASIDALNDALKSDYGRRFLDLRRYLIDYGLDDSGIYRTPSDVADIAADIVPSSLRQDAVHPTSTGRIVVANQIARRLAEFGWATWTPQAFPPVTDMWASRPNLITNPTFETDTAGWSLSGSAGGAMARDTTKPYDGVASLKVTVTGIDGQGARQPPFGRIPVAPSKASLVRVRVFGPASMTIRIVVHFYDASDTYLSNTQSSSVGIGDWETRTVTFTTPATAAGAVVDINHNDTVSGDFWIDGVELYQSA